MKYTKAFLQELVGEGEMEHAKIVDDEITGKSRWSILHRVVFHDSVYDKYFSTRYSRGATENQDEQPYEYDAETIECKEVFPVEVVVVKYVSQQEKDRMIVGRVSRGAI